MFAIKGYLKFLFNILRKKDTHFFDLFIDDKIDLKNYAKVEYLRKILKNDKQTYKKVDFGAGSNKNKFKIRKISDETKYSCSSPKKARILYQLIKKYKPQYCLEIGTSVGISTFYQALAQEKQKKKKFITIEGCPNTYIIAKKNRNILNKKFKEIDINHIEFYNANLDEDLKNIIEKYPRLDYVFFDGNHRKTPTLRYFECCLKKASQGAIFVFDDIYWSKEMKHAWKKIKKHHRIARSIDLFKFGIVFIDRIPQL